MDIFKLFFHHDLRLDELGEDNSNEDQHPLDDFMSPTLTFSRFYLTGTLLEQEQIGLDMLENSNAILQQLNQALSSYNIYQADAASSLSQKILHLPVQHAIILTPAVNQKPPLSPAELNRNSPTLSPVKDSLRDVLKMGSTVLYKEKATHGFDLQILSMENIYEHFFHAFKSLISDQFRFFSINSKRIHSREKFFFELYSLQKPPHGAEEVREDTILNS